MNGTVVQLSLVARTLARLVAAGHSTAIGLASAWQRNGAERDAYSTGGANHNGASNVRMGQEATGVTEGYQLAGVPLPALRQQPPAPAR